MSHVEQFRQTGWDRLWIFLQTVSDQLLSIQTIEADVKVERQDMFRRC